MRLYLTVFQGWSGFGYSGESDLYIREVEAEFVPGAGDLVAILPDVMWEVRRRYLLFDGSVGVDLLKMAVDPQIPLSTEELKIAASWYTGRDGDPDPLLLDAGWRKTTHG